MKYWKFSGYPKVTVLLRIVIPLYLFCFLHNLHPNVGFRAA